MKRLMIALATSAAVGLASSAYAADEASQANSKVEYKKNGGYEAKSKAEQKMSDGTTKEAEKNVDVDVDSHGKVDAMVNSEASTDPKGMMNAKKDTNKSKFMEKDNGGYKKTTTKKHHDAEGTDTKVEKTTDVDVDSNGNTTATTKTEQMNDPKGMMNKTTKTTKTKMVNGVVVEEKKD